MCVSVTGALVEAMDEDTLDRALKHWAMTWRMPTSRLLSTLLFTEAADTQTATMRGIRRVACLLIWRWWLGGRGEGCCC